MIEKMARGYMINPPSLKISINAIETPLN